METWKPNLEKYSFEFKKRVIILYCRGKTHKEISKIVGKGEKTIQAIVKHYWIGRNHNWKTTERFERKVIYLYTHTNVGATKISRYLGVKEGLVCTILKRNGVSIKTPDSFRRYDLNEHYFDVIDTEEKAYWLGFLMADGCNSRDRAIKFSLNKQDLDSLEKFNKSIGSNAPIKDDQHDMKTLMIHSRRLVNELMKYGFIRNKTHQVVFPDLEEEFYRHFIRGLFDGDGCITVGIKKSARGKTKGASFMIAGTEMVLTTIQEILINNCQVSRTKLIKRKSIHVLTYGGTRMLERIYHYLYDDSTIYMERKYAKFTQFLIDKNYL